MGWDSMRLKSADSDQAHVTSLNSIFHCTVRDSTRMHYFIIIFYTFKVHRRCKLGVRKGKQRSAVGMQNYHVIFLLNIA